MVSLYRISNRYSGKRGTTTDKENTARFHDIKIRSSFVHPTEDRADTKRSDRGIQGINLDILPKTFRYILQREHRLS